MYLIAYIQNFPHTNFQLSATSVSHWKSLQKPELHTFVPGRLRHNRRRGSRYFPSSGFGGSDFSFQTPSERNLLLKSASVVMSDAGLGEGSSESIR